MGTQGTLCLCYLILLGLVFKLLKILLIFSNLQFACISPYILLELPLIISNLFKKNFQEELEEKPNNKMCLILTLLKFGAFVAIWDKPRHIDQSNKKVTKSHGTFCIATYI